MPKPARTRSCPHCGRPVRPDDFLCAQCEIILNTGRIIEFPDPPRVPSVIEVLIAPPEPSLERTPRPPPPPPEALADAMGRETRVYDLGGGGDEVPQVTMGLDLDAQRLSSFEAFVVSFVDGVITVDGLARKIKRPRVEVQSVLENLAQRGIVRVEREELEEKTDPGVPDFGPARGDPRKHHSRPPPVKTASIRPPPPRTPMARAERAIAAPLSRRIAPAPPPPKPKPGVSPAGPLPSDGALQRAIALERTGHVEDAIKVLERAIASSRQPAPLFNRLALVLVKERRDFVRAEKLLNKALALEPNNDVYSQNLFKVLSMAATLTGRGALPKSRSRR